MQGYQGGICGYLYESANGDPGANIPGNPVFEDLPTDWVCPIRGPGKSSSLPRYELCQRVETTKALGRLNRIKPSQNNPCY